MRASVRDDDDIHDVGSRDETGILVTYIELFLPRTFLLVYLPNGRKQYKFFIISKYCPNNIPSTYTRSV